MGSIIVLILLFFVIYPIVWGVKGIKRVNSGNKEITPKWLLRLPVILLIFGLISSLFGIMIEPEIPKDDLARYLDNRGIWGGIANEALDYFSPAQIDYINKVNICNKLGWLSLVITPILFIVQALGLFKNMFGRVYIQGAAILTTLLTLITFLSFTSAMDAMMNNTATMRAISIIAPNSSSFDIQGFFVALLYFAFMHFAFHKCLDKVYGVITKENYRDYMQLPFNKTVINSLNEPNLKECPHCGGTIQTIAKKCIHCGQWLVEKNETDNIEHDIVEDKKITFKNFVNKKYIIPFVVLLVSIIGVCFHIFSQNQIYENNQNTNQEYDSLAIANSGSENEINGVSGASNQAPNLLPTIEELYKQKTYATEVIKHPLIKDYIISRYSSRFYDLLIESAGVNIPLEYDSKSNKYSSWVRGKYEYTLSYECAINYLEIKLTTVDGIKINKDGRIDCGLWKNGFYKDDFGEDDPNFPYIQVKLDAKKNGYPEPMYLRFCSSEGFKILIDGVKKEADLSIKVKSNGEVIKFAVDEIQDNERCIIYSRDKIDTLVPILENGNFMMSLTYEAPLGDFFRCVVDVTDETKGFLAALKFYLID